MSSRMLAIALTFSVLTGLLGQGGGPPVTPPGKPDNPGSPGNPPNPPGPPSDPGKPDNPGKPGNGGGDSAPKIHASIIWLTDRDIVDGELKEAGESTIKFKSSGDLTNVDVWVTPSLSGLNQRGRSPGSAGVAVEV